MAKISRNLVTLAALVLSAGIGDFRRDQGWVWADSSDAILLLERLEANRVPQSEGEKSDDRSPRVVYPQKTTYDFEAMQLEGELKNPGEFYFQVKPEEKMDSLVKRRKNFHRQMLRDVMSSK